MNRRSFLGLVLVSPAAVLVIPGTSAEASVVAEIDHVRDRMALCFSKQNSVPIVGNAGPEVIMPLKCGADGRLCRDELHIHASDLSRFTLTKMRDGFGFRSGAIISIKTTKGYEA